MSTITVYSKCPNSAKITLYKTQTAKDSQNMKITTSTPLKEVIILGTNAYKKQIYKSLQVECYVAETTVEKTLWDEIVAEYGDNHPLLTNGQIFVAKSRQEAEIKASDAKLFISDVFTAANYKSKTPVIESRL